MNSGWFQATHYTCNGFNGEERLTSRHLRFRFKAHCGKSDVERLST